MKFSDDTIAPVYQLYCDERQFLPSAGMKCRLTYRFGDVPGVPATSLTETKLSRIVDILKC